VPALEVGRHAVHVDGSAVNGEVAAPPVTQPEPAVLNLQLPP